MDALHSLRARCDSFDSVGSFAVLSTSDSHRRSAAEPRGSDSGEYDDDDWEVLSEDEDGDSNNIGSNSAAAMQSTLVIRERHFAHADEELQCAAASKLEEPEGEPGSSKPTAASASTHEPPECAAIAPLSPSSKSRSAKEALKAFYLARARQTEAKRKLIVVHPPLPSPPPSTSPPPPQNAILPLKAPDRYSVAVRDAAIQKANAQRATAALQQFYQTRELARQQRAALNRSNEASLIRSQSGCGALPQASSNPAA